MKKLIYLVMVVLSLTVASISFGTPFQNGSFENGPNPVVFTTLSAGDTSITGWTVTQGSIDYIGSYWVASDGSRSLDLNGSNAQGGIAQTFDTVIGTLYNVSFDLAGNYDNGPEEKVMDVVVALYTGEYTFLNTAATHSNMGWTSYNFQFTANAASSTLTFTSITHAANIDDSWGPALDNVKVDAVPEPATMLLLGLGLLGVAGIRRKVK